MEEQRERERERERERDLLIEFIRPWLDCKANEKNYTYNTWNNIFKKNTTYWIKWLKNKEKIIQIKIKWNKNLKNKLCKVGKRVKIKKERKKETDRETDIQRGRQRDRGTGIETDRGTETDRETEGYRDRETEREK